MSLNNESYNSSDDESFQSSKSIIFSSGRSSSPAWSRSSSMSSGISTISTTSSEGKRKLKAQFGPITRPMPTELRSSSEIWKNNSVQQQNNQESFPKPEQMKSKKKSFLPALPKIVRPITNIPQPQGWVTYHGLVYGPPVPPHPMMYYPTPAIQCPMTYPVPVPPMLVHYPVGTPMYNQLQARYVNVQTQHIYTWTYVDYSL